VDTEKVCKEKKKLFTGKNESGIKKE